jgi:hypothetical protein
MVQVSHRSFSRTPTILSFGFQPTLHILAQVIHILLRHAEFNIHEDDIQEQLDDRQRHWQKETDTAQDEVYAARHALSDCESEPADDDGDFPSCGIYEDQLIDAERALAICEENLETVKQWGHRIESLIADFQNDIHRLSDLSSSRASSAQAFLAKKMELLNNYIGGIASTIKSPGLQTLGGHGIMSVGSIPELFDTGGTWNTLPPGIHSATLVQIQERFAINEKRKLLFEGLNRGVAALKQAGCKTVYLDGSFISDKPEPGDFDVCWDPANVDDSKIDPILLDFSDLRKNQKIKFHGEFFPSTSMADDRITYLKFFQLVKYTKNPKGILKINL